jgi:hypothetical protein
MTIHNVTQSAFNGLLQKLTTTHQTAVSPSSSGSNAGQIMGHGVVANYAYRPDTQVLTVDVQHHPFYVPLSLIELQLYDGLGMHPAEIPA